MFLLSPERALVSTVDFFTPIVDDPSAWGAIAAANALSDIYAMGATPLFGLNLVGWPREQLPFEVLGKVLEGAAQVAERLRVALSEREILSVVGEPLHVTASFGAAASSSATTVAQLVGAADEALYRAKRAGKDRVYAGTEPVTRH